MVQPSMRKGWGCEAPARYTLKGEALSSPPPYKGQIRGKVSSPLLGLGTRILSEPFV